MKTHVDLLIRLDFPSLTSACWFWIPLVIPPYFTCLSHFGMLNLSFPFYRFLLFLYSLLYSWLSMFLLQTTLLNVSQLCTPETECSFTENPSFTLSYFFFCCAYPPYLGFPWKLFLKFLTDSTKILWDGRCLRLFLKDLHSLILWKAWIWSRPMRNGKIIECTRSISIDSIIFLILCVGWLKIRRCMREWDNLGSEALRLEHPKSGKGWDSEDLKLHKN